MQKSFRSPLDASINISQKSDAGQRNSEWGKHYSYFCVSAAMIAIDLFCMVLQYIIEVTK